MYPTDVLIFGSRRVWGRLHSVQHSADVEDAGRDDFLLDLTRTAEADLRGYTPVPGEKCTDMSGRTWVVTEVTPPDDRYSGNVTASLQEATEFG